MELIFISSLLCLLTTLAIILRSKSNKTPIKLPSGPSRLPIIGNLHNLGDQPHKSLAHLAKIHGPLMSLKLSQITTIVASSPVAAKQILQKHDQSLSNRNTILAVQAHDHHQFGLSVLPMGPTWRNLRKVCNVYLFASRKLDSNQDIRSKKIAELLEGVRRNVSQGGKVVDIWKTSFRTTFSALSSNLLLLDFEGVAEFMEAAGRFREAEFGEFFSGSGEDGFARDTETDEIPISSIFTDVAISFIFTEVQWDGGRDR